MSKILSSIFLKSTEYVSGPTATWQFEGTPGYASYPTSPSWPSTTLCNKEFKCGTGTVDIL